MVRFIILCCIFNKPCICAFTFQYGQIYYTNTSIHQAKYDLFYIPIWLDLLYDMVFILTQNIQVLHSNMVRFIINLWSGITISQIAFTFQYGQIYYTAAGYNAEIFGYFYIPIWLDLLLLLAMCLRLVFPFLHSNMVRFIMIWYKMSRSEHVLFYIPIWLDLLFRLTKLQEDRSIFLHSNMVRFIIRERNYTDKAQLSFTFQYGQIYYRNKRKTIQKVYKFYIPIWFDLLSSGQEKEPQRKSILHSNMVRFIIFAQV